MRNDTVKSHNFTRRAIVLAGGNLLLLTVLGARLYQLQMIDADKYQTMAEGNRVRIFPTMPRRGKLLDRKGDIIAEGQRRYQVVFEPMGSKEATTILQKAAELLEMDFNTNQALQKKLAKLRFNETLLVQDFVEWDQVTKIEVNAQELPGVRVITPEVRHYPYGAATAPFTGYIGIPSEHDIQDNELYRQPDFRIGKTGIELTQETQLQGHPGIREVEVNARGAFVRELRAEKDTPGEDITLTIDMDLQKIAVEQLTGKGGLKTEGGSAVLMDIETGGVLAMASVPSYDPNQFVRGIKPDYWKTLNADLDKPLTNKAISPYPPGSTFKTITAMAALEAGLASEHTSFYCGGYYAFGGRRFHCSHSHGSVNLPQAIGVSCNVYFYNLGRIVGIERLAAMARKFGLDAPTGLELPGEKAGLIADEAWKRKTFKQPWYAGETLSIAIGQGYTLATPAQLVTQVARIASGKRIKPTFIANRGMDGYEMVLLDNGEKMLLPGKKQEFENMDVNPAHLALVRRGMYMAINEPHGTGYSLRDTGDPDYLIAGKTGTSQVLSNKRFENVPAERAQRYHAVFIGFAPVGNPRFAASVLVEHGGYGATAAAPVAKALLLKAREIKGEI